ncbi:uncharacterized protein A1O9_07456 [Exophiala aquamarina CBS 119918]|uniref:Major facilitator superfamily (MFS) profile domain-containing protein n=1 Tax=Exophiala aquamarina CBS 119918 TaxID=1182545 RepID=A0A072P7Q5_9EURO|nr:uncharacterized protein A1O9_07456 [Exophiala aquamarina CBS 119918]KEF55876.1 hypothetical protein A1O9_07456 [Exophiala aquamarina CBS 119918]
MERQKKLEEAAAVAGISPDAISLRSISKQYDEFTAEDSLNPRQWPLSKRVWICALTAFSMMVVTFASAIFATIIPSLVRIHGVDREVVTLGVSLYVLGFAIGPVVRASFSELKGRYPPFILSMVGFVVFSFGTAIPKNLTSILVCRWFWGFFGAGPLTLAGPLNADMFVGKSLGTSMPTGGFIVENHDLGWEWTQYTCGILGAAALIPLIFVLQETYAPVILSKKASRMLQETGNDSITSQHTEISLSLRIILIDYTALPLKMLVSDPIVLLMSLFDSFVCGLLYLFLVGYPVVFQKIHGMKPGDGGLPYLGLIVGDVFAVLAILLTQPWIMNKAKQNRGVMMPEWQLPVAVPGAVAFSAGLFWYGWTGYRRDIHWIVPTLSGVLTGFGLLATFIPSISYLVQARSER